jgi:hypothetical protein
VIIIIIIYIYIAPFLNLRSLHIVEMKIQPQTTKNNAKKEKKLNKRILGGKIELCVSSRGEVIIKQKGV